MYTRSAYTFSDQNITDFEGPLARSQVQISNNLYLFFTPFERNIKEVKGRKKTLHYIRNGLKSDP